MSFHRASPHPRPPRDRRKMVDTTPQPECIGHFENPLFGERWRVEGAWWGYGGGMEGAWRGKGGVRAILSGENVPVFEALSTLKRASFFP